MMAPPLRALVVHGLGALVLTARGAAAQKADGHSHNCNMASMNVLMTAMVDGCCADPSNCPADQIAPNMCDSNCAEVFEPFWGSCGSMLQTMQMPGVDEYAEFADLCWAQLFTPGECSAGCDARNFDCLAEEVSVACCDTDGECTDGIPTGCDFECSVKLKPFVTNCEHGLLVSELGAATANTLQAAASACIDQDPAALLNHVFEVQNIQQCELDLSGIRTEVEMDGGWRAGAEDGQDAGECSELQEAVVRECIADCDKCKMAPTLVVAGDCAGRMPDDSVMKARDLITFTCSGQAPPGAGAGNGGGGGGGASTGGGVGGGVGADSVTTVVDVMSTGGVPTYTTYRLGVRLPPGSQNLYSIGGSRESPMNLPAAFQVATPFGTDIGGTNEAFWAINPQAEFDSWLTVGVTDGTGATAISTAGIDFSSWNEAPIVTRGEVIYIDSKNAPTGVGKDSIAVAQLTLPSKHAWTATMNLKGKLPSTGNVVGADWTVVGVQFSMCTGKACPGGGHRRQLQLSRFTHPDGDACSWDQFDDKAAAMVTDADQRSLPSLPLF